MGMLPEHDMLTALINNLGDNVYWTVNPTYPLDKEYGGVVVRAAKVYRKIKYDTVLENMCDKYCKYLATISGHCSGDDYKVRNVDELERYCNKCPLKQLLSEEPKGKN